MFINKHVTAAHVLASFLRHKVAVKRSMGILTKQHESAEETGSGFNGGGDVFLKVRRGVGGNQHGRNAREAVQTPYGEAWS